MYSIIEIIIKFYLNILLDKNYETNNDIFSGHLWKKDTDYLFEIELPCSPLIADYTEIVSSDFNFLDRIKNNIVL